MKVKLFFSAVAFLALTSLANAQSPQPGKRLLNGTGRGPYYVDADKNGICDRFENNRSYGRNARWNGYGSGQALGQQGRQGQGQGRGRGRGRGRNFIDANKNGICDYYEPAGK